MKAFLSVLMMCALFAGCEKASTSGGPGAKNENKDRPNLTQADNSFSLDVPNLQTSVKQGETKTIAIGINRGKNFDQDVTVTFEKAPAGVTIAADSPMIKKDDKEVNVKITAAADAALGEHMIMVRGKPATGPDATNEFKVQVDKP